MTHITKSQRYTISILLKNGKNRTEIAEALGKHKSSIGRELKRNCDNRNKEYKCDLAQRKYSQRQAEKPKKQYFTDEIKRYVLDGLAQYYSPEQIVGRAKLENVPCVSHERIYQYVWKDKKSGGKHHENLRNRGRKYRKRGSLKDRRGIIKNRVDISERPEIVDAKERFGDLEIDTMIGKNHQGALLTINDRATGLVWIRLLDGKEAEPLTKSAIEALMPIKHRLHTITADNGKEFAKHETIAKELDLNVYFARPYHSWERGANENTNGLIRQYFPKGSSFENVTHEQVMHVQNELNSRPRKKLGFLSPNEYFLANFETKRVAFTT
jgi:IS30 family transposase